MTTKPEPTNKPHHIPNLTVMVLYGANAESVECLVVRLFTKQRPRHEPG